MTKNFRLHLTITMIAFSIFISLIVSLINQEKIRNKLFEEHAFKLSMIENNIISSLNTIDKAYMLFDKGMGEEMEAHSKTLLSMYEKNPKLHNWNYEELKKRFGMDVYVLDHRNVIIHSSVKQDIGLDFRACCANFSSLLNLRREEGKFIHDGMDIEQSSGALKKYSYMPTPDKKYMFELGISLEDDEICKNFNFLSAEKEMELRFPMIESIKVYNSGGFILGSANKGEEDLKDSIDKWETFRKALKTGDRNEIDVEQNGEKVTYRYVPYRAEQERGYSTKRVVEIAYNKNDLEEALNQSLKEFFIQLLVIIIGAIIISLLIAQRVARPMYLAFHDSLTGVKNRATFEELVKGELDKGKGRLALMMIDLDNFKLVNDRLGHTEGDHILKAAAQVIRACAGKANHAARLGGDEFVIIFPDTDEDGVRRTAKQLIQEMHRRFRDLREKQQIDVSISVGIAFASKEDDAESLYQKADQALYESKKNGKNQFQIFDKIS